MSANTPTSGIITENGKFSGNSHNAKEWYKYPKVQKSSHLFHDKFTKTYELTLLQCYPIKIIPCLMFDKIERNLASMGWIYWP